MKILSFSVHPAQSHEHDAASLHRNNETWHAITLITVLSHLHGVEHDVSTCRRELAAVLLYLM